MIRTFIAIELPKPVTDHIALIQKEIRSEGFSAKWVRPENIHLTLKFLGSVDPAIMDSVGHAVSESVKEVNPFTLSAKGIGAFPDVRRPRVLWVGMKGDIFRLIEFQKVLESRLEAVGFPKEGRPFQAHLTVARIKDRIDSKKLVEAIHRFGDFESAPFTADEVIVFKSDLKPSGPVYTKLKTVKIGLLK